ncbi:hypothetical protein BGZ72_008051 [Mortierella alpina]|nr:hypothetical protein BGZ72_008051 [Mortierella alpina]
MLTDLERTKIEIVTNVLGPFKKLATYTVIWAFILVATLEEKEEIGLFKYCMKHVIADRKGKIKELQGIVSAYDAVKRQALQLENVTDLTPTQGTLSGSTERSRHHAAYLQLAPHWPRFRGEEGIANAQVFFDAFKREVVAALSPESLKTDGGRYLVLLIKDEDDADAFNKVLKEDGTTSFDKDTLERLFFKACITQKELSQALAEMAAICPRILNLIPPTLIVQLPSYTPATTDLALPFIFPFIPQPPLQPTPVHHVSSRPDKAGTHRFHQRFHQRVRQQGTR